MHNQRFSRTSSLLLLLAVTGPLLAALPMVRLVTQPGSRVTVEGGNNIHDWQLTGEVLDGTVSCGVGFPLKPNQIVRRGDVPADMTGSIPILSLHLDASRSNVMDRIVYRALKEQTHPRITFHIDDFILKALPKTNGAPFSFDAFNNLVVAGVTNDIPIALSVLPLADRTLRITTTMALKMSDFGIEPPAAQGEGFTIRTKDAIQVTLDWLVAPAPQEDKVPVADPLPPFVAEGSITTSNRFSQAEARFAFYSSNSWWQVDLTGFTTPPHYQSQNCMQVPGGIRSYTQFNNVTNWPSASAYAINFPPPGIGGGMFQVWLSLCPRPKLPRIDGQRMHRFLTVPSAPFAILFDPVNQGPYTARYLEPGHAFLSDLRIANDGLNIVWNPDNVEIHRFAVPFDRGFPEFEYRVLQSTNLHGLAFPWKATMHYYGIHPEDRTKLAVYMTCEINVARISFAEADLAKQVHPARLDGFDGRSTDPRRANSAYHTIINDQWPVGP